MLRHIVIIKVIGITYSRIEKKRKKQLYHIVDRSKDEEGNMKETFCHRINKTI
jgi:hypothetical protein